jgi:hypothetical protein
MTNAPLPSGIYLVNIQAGTQIKSEKVTLLIPILLGNEDAMKT